MELYNGLMFREVGVVQINSDFELINAGIIRPKFKTTVLTARLYKHYSEKRVTGFYLGVIDRSCGAIQDSVIFGNRRDVSNYLNERGVVWDTKKVLQRMNLEVGSACENSDEGDCEREQNS